MRKGKLIVIEGTNCIGKETQSKLLVKNLKKEGYKAINFSFPNYKSPTGKIIGDAYLGKNGQSFFSEGSANVNPKISSLYYAADRLYNIDIINKYLEDGFIVVLNRYVESNMAYEGGKIKDIKARNMMYEWLDNLEFVLLELPRPDLVIYLYLPYEYVLKIKNQRGEPTNEDILRMSEIAYFELAEIYEYHKINCLKDNNIRSINDIANEINKTVKINLEMDENNEYK